MKKGMQMVQKGFTLVELLIVVIIIAILAAVLVPQFSGSTDDAKLAALDSTLSNMRTAVDLYYQQHGKYPGAATAAGATCPLGGTAGTGLLNTQQAFIEQLTRYTNAAGQACTTTDATFKYGPYLKKDAIPANPITDNNTIVISTVGALGMTGAVAPGLGWKFDVKSGQFIADHVDYDER